MPIYTGKSADGSDMQEVKGAYESPCSLYFSSRPYTREQKAHEKVYNHCIRYRKTFRMLYEQLKTGSKENLPKWVRDWFIKYYEQ
jgi:hypothetical protein